MAVGCAQPGGDSEAGQRQGGETAVLRVAGHAPLSLVHAGPLNRAPGDDRYWRVHCGTPQPGQLVDGPAEDATGTTPWLAATAGLCAELAAGWPVRSGPVLELGCGVGGVGLFVASRLMGATERLTLTDANPAALALAAENVERHGVGQKVQCVLYEWGADPLPEQLGSGDEFGLILASDVLYAPPLARRLVAALVQLGRAGRLSAGAVLCLSHVERYSVTIDDADSEAEAGEVVGFDLRGGRSRRVCVERRDEVLGEFLETCVARGWEVDVVASRRVADETVLVLAVVIGRG